MQRRGAYGPGAPPVRGLTELAPAPIAANLLAGPRLRPSFLFIRKATPMSRRCEITGVGPMTGHNVSHSNVKTKRRFLPSLAEVTLASEVLGQTFKLKITNAALRTLDARGGLDPVLLNARDEALSPRALKIKRQIKAKSAHGAA